MTTTSFPLSTWQKSSYSAQQTNCVEIAADLQATRVRDTKARIEGHIEIPSHAWKSLISRL